MKEGPKTQRKTVKERIANNLKRQTVIDLSSESEGDDLDRESGGRASPELSKQGGNSALLRSSMTGLMQQKMRGSFLT